MEGKGRPVEITIRRLEEEEPVGCRWSVAFALQFGDRQIEAALTDDDRVIARWIQDVHRVHRERLRGGRRGGGGGSGGLVVGLCIFRRTPWLPNKKERRDAVKRRDDYRVSAIALSAGGTHCLVVPVDDYDSYHSRCPLPRPLAAFAADRRNTFVGIDITKAAERLERVCGAHVANAMELRPLVVGAFGRHAGPPFKGSKGDPDGLRGMARVALRGVDAGKRPETIEFNQMCVWESKDKVIVEIAGEEQTHPAMTPSRI